LLLLVTFALLTLPACTSSGQFAFYQDGHASDGPALGSVTLASQQAGHVTFAPANCYAGDERQFLGGDFVDAKAEMSLRFVIDPLDGPAVRAFDLKDPDDRSVVFHRRECRTFQFKIERTGLTVNDVDEYRISLDLDCASSAGTLTAKVGSDSCL
jgi:hypothetical protein